VLDLGTGCGAVAISIAADYQRTCNTESNSISQTWPAVEVTATDNSVCALNIARENARQLNADVTFYLSSWFNHLPEKKWQLIVSNPPYLAAHDSHLATLRHEPQSALIAQDNGLSDIKEIIYSARKYLLANGGLMIEHGDQQGGKVASLMKQAGYVSVHTETDIANRDRVTLGQLS